MMSLSLLPNPIDEAEAGGLNDLARRVAHELENATALAERCQDAVAEITDRDGPGDCIIRLQALDGLTQHLQELARLFVRLSEADDLGRSPKNLFDDVKLSDLKRRLSGAGPIAEADDEPELW